jgi:4-hydroxybenzoyl-CoA thioesterase
MSEMTSFKVRVGWGDCDPAGIVFYPNFFRWFDDATAHLFAMLGIPLPELQARYGTLGVPLLEASAKFAAPARPQEEIEVRSRVVAVNTKTFELRHEIFRGATQLLEGREVRVWAFADASRPRGMRAESIPAEVAARLAAAG